jgi:phosphoribosyl 1,2-cyclic phosphodiesterase
MLKETAEALGIENHHRVKVIQPPESFKVGSCEVTPFYVPHDVPCVAFFVETETGERMVYITDCTFCPAVFPALDLIALEINHDKETLYGNKANTARQKRTRLNHMSLEAALKLLRDAATPRLKEVHVLHMSNTTSDEKKILMAVQAATGVPTFIAEE